MRFYTTLIATLLLFIAFAFTSCSLKQQQLLFDKPIAKTDTAALALPANSGIGTSDYHIKSQDILQIRNLQNARYIVDDVPAATTGTGTAAGGTPTAGSGQTYQVEEDGTVALPVIGHVQVAGLTRAEAAKKIEDLYRKNVLVNPIIDLKITNLKVTVLGEIRVQGNYPLTKDKTSLIEVIGEAGGLTERANEKTIKILRGDPKNPQVTLVDLSKTSTLSDPRIILQNNDIIYIAESKRAVKNDQLSNFSNTVQPILLILNTFLIIYTVAHH